MNLDKLKQEARELKCVNGAMYFGSVEDDSCNCKTRCQNEQTYEHALEELDSFIDHIAATITNEMTHEWNKAEQRLDGTAQGAVNAIEQYRNYLTQAQAIIKDSK